jgi:F-type H+-transporting ATPase subunit alpha
VKILRENDALKYSIIVHASGNEIAGHQFIAPYVATSMAEYFMEKGKHVLIAYDDLTKQARAYREISLLLGKNPGREAYPADIFYIHSKLLERATKMKDEFGGGSITSLPIVETEAENISAYIPTNVISITDGQIYLSPNLFQKGILPAIDVGKSVSRVGSSAQLPAYRQVASTLGIEYSQFEELESFSKFSSSLDETSEKIINRGKKIREILKQRNGNTLTCSEQIAILLCLNGGIFDKIPLERVKYVEKTAIFVLNEDFDSIRILVKSGKKILPEVVSSFIAKVEEKLNV